MIWIVVGLIIGDIRLRLRERRARELRNHN
jgi:uncharacterized membrane-anchored protein YhcB (DUF1043 family)